MEHSRDRDAASSAFHAQGPVTDPKDAAPNRGPRGLVMGLALSLLLWSAVAVAILVLR